MKRITQFGVLLFVFIGAVGIWHLSMAPLAPTPVARQPQSDTNPTPLSSNGGKGAAAAYTSASILWCPPGISRSQHYRFLDPEIHLLASVDSLICPNY